MTDQDRKTKITGAAMLVAAAAIVIAMTGAGLALSQRFGQTAQRRAEQASFNRQLAQESLDNCHEIEKLKRAVRQQAVEDYQHLDRNLRILGIKKTKSIARTARQARDEKLTKFAEQVCPRPITRR